MLKWKFVRGFIKENKSLTALAILTGLCYNIFMVLVPISFGKFYEFNFGFSSARFRLLEKVFPFINSNEFTIFLGFFVGIILIRFMFEFANKFVIGVLGERFTKSLRERLFSHQLYISNSIYEEKGTGKYLLRFSGDLKSIQNYLTQGIFRFTQDIILIIILLAIIGYFSHGMVYVILAFIFLAFSIIFFLNKILYNASLKQRNCKSGLLSYVSKVLGSITAIKVFNKQVPIQKRYNKRSLKQYNFGVNYQKIVALINASIPLITYVMVGFTMYFVYLLKQQGTNFDEASFLVLVLLIISFLPIFRRILSVNIVWKLGNISFQKLNAIFMLKKESTSYIHGVKLNNRDIKFEHVAFSQNTVSLHQYHFKIKASQTHFFKTSFGNMKSLVFIKLLLKLSSPTEGIIYYGKHSFKELSEKTIRKNITVVSTKLALEGRTVFEAISYSISAVNRSACIEVLDSLQKYVPENQRLSLDSKIGEHNKLLSDSQLQLLLWCRSILSDKKVWILHFPFKYLNENLTTYLIQLINDWNGSKTIILLNEDFLPNFKTDTTQEL